MSLETILKKAKKEKYSIFYFGRGKCPLREIKSEDIIETNKDYIITKDMEIPLMRVKIVKKGNKNIWKKN
jgi:uncharacterized protein (UPF0248 family)